MLGVPHYVPGTLRGSLYVLWPVGVPFMSIKGPSICRKNMENMLPGVHHYVPWGPGPWGPFLPLSLSLALSLHLLLLSVRRSRPLPIRPWPLLSLPFLNNMDQPRAKWGPVGLPWGGGVHRDFAICAPLGLSALYQ